MTDRERNRRDSLRVPNANSLCAGVCSRIKCNTEKVTSQFENHTLRKKNLFPYTKLKGNNSNWARARKNHKGRDKNSGLKLYKAQRD